MNILYLSAHEILEFNEVSMFNELGYDIFSPGAYVEESNRGDNWLRPSIPNLHYNPDIVQHYHRICALCPGQDAKYHLTKDFVDHFNIVIVMHIPQWITGNWEAIKHKRVIWRTIGQSIDNVEKQLKSYREQGLQIVRYSPREQVIPGYIGHDAIIRFYCDENIYKDWNGHLKHVITFAQSMKDRGVFCGYDIFEQATYGISRKLFGPGNAPSEELNYGKLSYEDQIKAYQDHAVYFYTGTVPACYTLNFIEALTTGIPIVAVGEKLGNRGIFPEHDLYEIQDIIENGKNGLISDDMKELKYYIKSLMNDNIFARKISEAGRKTAIELFGKEKIKQQWKKFLC